MFFFKKKIKEQEIKDLYKMFLSREPSEEDVKAILSGDHNEKLKLIYSIVFSAEFLKKTVGKAMDFHAFLIHNARIKLIMSLLPRADVIVDLGGANGSIYDMGYPYKFTKITNVDLPPDKRHEMYKAIDMKPLKTPNGPVEVLYSNMTDLSHFEDNSVDLVWSGQSIEHISESDAKIVFKEVMRILKPKGFFCLDTPNRLLTEIHTKNIDGGWIHPEHKIEYYPKHLRNNLIKAGFKITKESGVCQMPRTWETKDFDYKDFVLGNPLPEDVDSAYIQYYECQKP